MELSSSVLVPPSVVRIEMGRDGTAFVRFRMKEVATADKYRRAQQICKNKGYKHDGMNAWRGPSWRLANLISEFRGSGFSPKLGPSVSSEMGRLAAVISDPGSDARADARMDAMEAATGQKFRPYQREDVRWMERTGSCVNANQVRTGKTVEILAMVPPAGAIVVCPLSVRGVWASHVKRWLPWCSVELDKTRWIPTPNTVTILNYEALPDPENWDIPAGVLLAADEAAALKNATSLRHRRFRAIADRVRVKGGRVILASGTPAPNRPAQELWPLLELIGAGKRIFGDKRSFSKEASQDYGPMGVAGRLGEVMTRRLLSEIAGDLPPYTWDDTELSWDDLGGGGADLKATLDRLWAKYKGEADILAAIQRHPQDISEYSRCRASLAELKAPLAVEWARNMQDQGEPALVISAHRAPVLQVGEVEHWGTILGGMSEKQRQENIDKFAAGELDGLAITIGAAGTGLDLSRADNVLFVDQSWVPGDNEQAAARVVSIANPKPKFGTRFLLDHPVEKRVSEVLVRKMIAIGGTVGQVGATGARSLNPLEALVEAHALEAPEDVDVAEVDDLMKGLWD